jgi:uroporphyrinogen decarboxylase
MVLTSKERVRLSLDFQEPDRPPIQIYTTPEISARLKEHFGGRSYIEPLGIDFRSTKLPTRVRGSMRKPSSGMTYDIWGVGYKEVAHEHGKYSEACYLPLRELTSLDEVDAYPWPNPDDYEYGDMKAECEKVEDYAVCFGRAGIPDILNGVGRGRGHDRVIKDIMTDDEVGTAVIDRRVDFWYDFCRRALEAADGAVDIFWLGEDLGTQNGPFFSLKKFREFYRPRLKRFFDLGHSFGAKVAMHCCGSSRALIPDLIDMGLDLLDAVQPEPVGMDPEGLKKDFGDKIAFCGLISTQKTLPFGTVDDCRNEALHRVGVIGKGGGYVFSPAHCIQPDTPIENIIAIYEVALGKKLPPAA